MPSISAATLDSLTGKTTAATTKAGETYTQFLQLLTTQLQNQDPLDPMESAEFTNQLVQFSQVEQAILGNEKLDALLSQTNANQMGQSLAYIGKSVYYRGDSIHYDGQPLKIGYAIDGDSKSAKMRILDANGQTIRVMDIKAGNTSGSLEWDGKDDYGQAVATDKTYSVRVDALSKTDMPLPTYTGVPANVQGVETLEGVLFLALNGQRRIEAASVLSISERDAPPEANLTPPPTTGGDDDADTEA